jgi:hypothetical protein
MAPNVASAILTSSIVGHGALRMIDSSNTAPK